MGWFQIVDAYQILNAVSETETTPYVLADNDYEEILAVGIDVEYASSDNYSQKMLALFRMNDNSLRYMHAIWDWDTETFT